MAEHPSFAGVTHPAFKREWLLAGLDRLFAADDRIESVQYELWATVYNDDHSNVQLRGAMNINFAEDADGNKRRIPEEELDEISAVRLLERRAEELWYAVPMLPDSEDGSINGEYSLLVRPGHIQFSYTSYRGDEVTYTSEALYEDGCWTARDTIILAQADPVLIDVASNDHVAVSQQCFDPAENELKDMPTTLGCRMTEDGLEIEVEPGQLAALTEHP